MYSGPNQLPLSIKNRKKENSTEPENQLIFMFVTVFFVSGADSGVFRGASGAPQDPLGGSNAHLMPSNRHFKIDRNKK